MKLEHGVSNGCSKKKRVRRAIVAAALAGSSLALTSLAPVAQGAPGSTTIASIGVGGGFGNGAAKEPAISADGRYVAFASSASNLVTGDTNGKDDVFVYDRSSGQTVLVSRSTSGELGNGNSSQPSMSPDGRYVAFVSDATNFQLERNPIVNGVEKNARDIFLRDLQLGTTIRVTLGGGNPGKIGASFDPSVSNDAAFVSFTSLDRALVGIGDCNDVHDVFLWERATGKYTLISKGTTNSTCGTQAAPYQGLLEGDRESQNPTISADGRYVVFSSDASNLDPTKSDHPHYNLPAPPLNPDPDLGTNIFLWDRITGTIKRIDNSINGGGEPDDDAGFVPTISHDGSHIAYMSDATDLVASDTNNLRDTFVYDVGTGQTTKASQDVNGVMQSCPNLQNQTGCQSYEAPSLSSNGRFVAFVSGATNLIANGFDSNVTGRDVYIKDNSVGTVIRASVDDNDTQGDAGTVGSAPSISADGRYVAFTSNAKNLVPGDANSVPQVADIFVNDRTPGSNPASWSTQAWWAGPGGCLINCGSNPGPGTTPTTGGSGYWMVASDGGIFAFGDAKFQGSTGDIKLAKPIVGMTTTPTGQGYWLVASDGGIFAFGDALFKGSTGNIKLAKPIVGMTSTPTGQGYWLVASDGGIFAFGDAKFQGSTGNIKLAKPIVGMTSTPSGGGYWMVASDGGVFAFGDAKFKGSTGNIKLAKPIEAMTSTPTGDGYWMVASDGGIFAFGDAEFKGSTGNIKLAQPIVAATATQTGSGYWLVARDGGVFAFGDALFKGSTGNIKLNQPIVGMTGF